MLVSQLRTEREPRNETTMSEFVVSVATKPVASVLRVLGEVREEWWMYRD
jgi:hypothetical protein